MKPLTDYDFPVDLKGMSTAELDLLAVEIRDFLIENIAKTGGHLASNLGIVELTIALHRFLDTPRDKLVYDVGHQCYVHKILTGRAEHFSTLRKMGGMSGFPKRAESVYDTFDVGHSSTSLSLMTGLAMARDLNGEDYRTVAVIGDGAMSGGLAYEALNNLGATKTKAIVVLNDNEMSIGKSTGGFENHLDKLRVSKGYYNFKEGLQKTVGRVPVVGEGVIQGLTKMRDSLKYVLVDGVIFEELGFTYLGPIDGHDIEAILAHLALADACEGPVVLHVITKKGKGYRNAEKDPEVFHGTGSFDTMTGKPLAQGNGPTFAETFGSTLCDLAGKDERIVAISAAMLDGTGLRDFSKRFPTRTYDVGIAEGYAVSFAAGLAASGMLPVVAVYSTFLQRAYDQMMIDVCLQDLPVVFAIDRAGNVGSDGETHHGVFDISYLNHMPNMTLLAPRDGEELAAMLAYALTLGSPCAIRYPRGEATSCAFAHTDLSTGAQVLSEGTDCELWAAGNMVSVAAEVVEILKTKGVHAGLIDPRFLKPIDQGALFASARRTKTLFTLEDNVLSGGFGEKIAARLCNEDVLVKSICWPDAFVEHGAPAALYEKYGFSAGEIAERIVTLLED